MEQGDAAARPGHDLLDRLLAAMVQGGGLSESRCDEIDRVFGEDAAVMVLDMSGFSRCTRRCGIVEGLLMTYRMRSLSSPLVAAHRGRIIKAEADNLYCLFPDVAEAIAASAAIGRRMEAANEALADDRKLYASIGIGYGRILNIGNRDFYGDEVNFASKLGEDIAKRGEILLTQGAFARLVGTAVETRQVSRVVSEMAMTYYHALPRAA